MNRALVIAVTGTAACLLAGCSASSTTTTPTPASANTVPTSTPAPTSAPTATPTPVPAAVDLSGSWTGQYSGAFNGTFTLTWTQSGATLSGDITLSAPPNTVHVSGNVGGTAITFGAVGGVTYSGSVSGNSMSGNYQVPGGGPGGTWSATKS
jgi:hypothetical protein